MPVRISIDRKKDNSVTFQEVSVSFSDTVFWMNNDPKAAHWPVLNGTKLTLTQIALSPSDNSGSWSVSLGGAKAPFDIVYGCAISQHGTEKGTIKVYPDFGPLGPAKPAKAFIGTVGTAFSQLVTAGGLGPYTFAVASGVPLGGGLIYGIPPGLSLNAGNAGVVLSGTPTNAGAYLFTLEAGDSQKNSFAQQNYNVVVS